MKNLLLRWLKIYEDEALLFIWSAFLLFFINVAQSLLNNYAETAFLKRFGVEYLPLMTAINAIARRHGLMVIEDAAQSFGAAYRGRRSCGLSTIGCTSFFPAKPLGCYGDGGACFTDDAAIASDNMQDLKAGHIVGATPYRQQIMQAVGVVAEAMVLAPVLNLLAFERHVAGELDNTVFVSEEEADLFRSLAPECAAKITYRIQGVDSDFFDPSGDYPDPFPAGAPALVFTGAMDYWPNVDAVGWFAEQAWPVIRRQVPNARFFIVGMRPTPEVSKLAEQPGITVTGAVPDVRPYLAHAHAAILPLRIARGIQNKVLEAMARSACIVSTRSASAIAGRIAPR